MLEDVFQLRKQLLLGNKIQALEVQQGGFKLFAHTHHRGQHAKSEFPADDRRHLHDPLQTFLHPVDAGGDNPLEGLRHLDVRGFKR